MKPHLPATLRRALLACSALTMGTSIATASDTDTYWVSSSETCTLTTAQTETDITTIMLDGGTLVVDTTEDNPLKDSVSITTNSGTQSTVQINTTLNRDKLTATETGTVQLTGHGTYNLGNNLNGGLGTGVSVGSSWYGTISATNATLTDGSVSVNHNLYADSLEISNGASLEVVDCEINGALEVNDASIKATNLLKVDTIHITGSSSHAEANLLKLGEEGLNMSGGTLYAGTMFSDYDAAAVITGGTVTIGGTMMSTTSVSNASFVGANTLSGSDARYITVGNITVEAGARLWLSDVTITGQIIVEEGSSLTLGGDMVVNSSQMQATNEQILGYSATADGSVSLSGIGFRTSFLTYTVLTGTGTITDYVGDWKIDSFEAAYEDGIVSGTIRDTSTYWLHEDTDTSLNSIDEHFTDETDSIALNGGKLRLDTSLNGRSIIGESGGKVEVDARQVLAKSEVTGASDTDRVILSGQGGFDLQGEEQDGTVEMAVGIQLDASAWSGTVYTGTIAQGAELDVTHLAHAGSSVQLGSSVMPRAAGDIVLNSLKADASTVAPGSLSLQSGTSTSGNLTVQGILTLGTENTAATLNAEGTVTLQGLNFAHTDSTLTARSLELGEGTTLSVFMAKELLLNLNTGDSLTLITLTGGAYEGAMSFNGKEASKGEFSDDKRRVFTITWNAAGTELSLSAGNSDAYVSGQVNPVTSNGQAGVAMLTDVFLNDEPAAGGAQDAILSAVNAGSATDRDMAAVAGASTAVLGLALNGDVERQLRSIRNRAATHHFGQDTVTLDNKGSNLAQPGRFFAWVSAEGNRTEQNADNTAAGYTLTSWGATAGAGMQMNHQLTLGMALTAMYGKLQSNAPDKQDGNMDTTYASAFTRYTVGAWSHTIIGTVGMMDADYKRSVLGYTNTGDTDGTTFGLMYELSRHFALNIKSNISPMFHISYRHTKVNDFNERGTDAALHAGEQRLDTITAGLGARYAAMVGQQTLNRACTFEARALARYEFGDRQSSTSAGFIGHSVRAGIDSAKLGAFGVELGAGISVPVGSGSLFADGAVELRSGYSDINGTVGYRMQF